jgi:hypothetical protein
MPLPDAQLETASNFGGPGAAAMSNMVDAVYGTSLLLPLSHAILLLLLLLLLLLCWGFCVCRALRGGFVPSPDAHLETASQFGGPGAAAMSNMVEAVYGTFAGDSRGVERSVEHLTHGTAGEMI